MKAIINLYILQALSKCFSVFYFVLLPIFFAKGLISTSHIGYIGAAFIVALIIGAILVTQWLHNTTTRKLLQLAALGSIIGSVALLASVWQASINWIALSYVIAGLSTGLAMSGVNAVAAASTTKGDRYNTLAKLGMSMDIIRIVFPAIVAGLVAYWDFRIAILLIIATAIYFLYIASFGEYRYQPIAKTLSTPVSLRKNKRLWFVLLLEFLDSFSSSQLFVFLPLLFLAKGYSLENSLILQSFVFIGYLSGRLLVSILAKRFSGVIAVAVAEIGLMITIMLLLVTPTLWLLYFLSLLLGIFARGTSPVIKAMAFDSLSEDEMKKGSAAHVIAGDSGSAIGQLLFGLLIAWFSINMPFIVAGSIAVLIAMLCLANTSPTKRALTLSAR